VRVWLTRVGKDFIANQFAKTIGNTFVSLFTYGVAKAGVQAMGAVSVYGNFRQAQHIQLQAEACGGY